MKPNLAPSSAFRWTECHASAILPSLVKDPAPSDRSDADEGIAAHHVAENMARGHMFEEGGLCPNGYAVTEAMVEGGALWASLTSWVAGEHTQGGHESRVELADSLGANAFGLVDAWGVWGPTLHVYDYKFGFSEVFAFENMQGLTYAVALVDKLKRMNLHIDTVQIHIVQPRVFRADPVDSWVLSVEELASYAVKIRNAVTDINSGSVQARTGAHCKRCPARFSCELLRAEGMEAVDGARDTSLVEIPDDQLGLELDELTKAREVLNSRISGLEERVAHKLKNGTFIPGWHLHSRIGPAAWTVEPEEVLALGKGCGFDLSKPTQTLTVAQTIKAFPALKSAAEALSERTQGRLKLEKINHNTIKKVFKK